MAGRGRALTMPAWMKKQQQEQAAAAMRGGGAPLSAPPSAPMPPVGMPPAPRYGGPTPPVRGGAPPSAPGPVHMAIPQMGRAMPAPMPMGMPMATGVPGQFADAMTGAAVNGNGNGAPAADSSRGSGRRSRSRERGHHRSRSRSRSSRRKERGRDREHSHRSSRSRRSGDRSRSRSRERSRRSDRDREHRGGSSSRHGSRRSRSGSRSLSAERRERRRRRKSNFDVRPPGVTDENAAAFAAQAILQQNMAALSGAVGPASFGPPPVVPVAPAAPFTTGHQQTRHARRLYVGGIGEISEQEITEFFNDVIDRALGQVQEGGAVVSVYINRERHFAFVELRTIELTTACMNLDGISFRGLQLKVRRPNDYNPATVPKDLGPIPQLNLAALGIVSTTVQDSPNKIFIGGIPYHLNDEQVKELLQAFGPLRSFHLVKELQTNMSKGYGFCEYMDPSATDAACLGLNDMKLGDKTLTVRRAMSQESAKAVASAAGSVNTGLSMGLDPTQAALQTMSMAGFPATPAGTPTRVIVLHNMVTPPELEDDEEYADILDDIKTECERFGVVQSVIIPRPRDGLASAVGKVFVEFGDVEAAQRASTELHGRGFANRIVSVEFMDEDQYARRDLA